MANGRNPGGVAFSMNMDLSGMELSLDGITRAAEDAVRPAAQAGIEEFYIEAKLRCPVSDHAHFFYGKNSKATGVRYYFEPGNLRNAIYQVYSKDNSGKGLATYHVAWNHKKAPYGFMVEFGTSRAAAHPFLRPAYDAARQQAMQIAKATLLERVEGAIR